MADKLEIIFGAQDRATPTIKDIDAELAKFGETAGDIAKGTAAALAVAATAIAVELTFAAKAAIEAEQNMARLDNALKNTGQATEANKKALTDQAAALQLSTKYSDDQIASLQILSLNMGRSADETQTIVAAGLDMATALGIDAETAVRGLSQSMSGNAGMLGKLNPAFRDMTEAALKNGEAIKFAARQYGGFAANEGATFGGLIDRLSNAFGDIQEAIGGAFTENADLKQGMAELLPILDDVKNLVVENKDTLIDLATYGFIGALESLNLFMQSGIVAGDMFLGMAIGIQKLSMAMVDLTNFMGDTEASIAAENEALANLKALETARANFQDFGVKVGVVGLKLDDLATRLSTGKLRAEAMAKGANDAKSGVDGLGKGAGEAAGKIAELDKAMASFIAKAAQNEFDLQLTGLTANDFAELEQYYKTKELLETELSTYRKKLDDERLAYETEQRKKADEAEAARKKELAEERAVGEQIGGGDVGGALTSGIGAATAGMGFAGGLVAGVAGVIVELSNASREQMDQFFAGIADQITNLTKNIDDIFIAFLNNADEIFVAVANGMLTMWAEMIGNLPEILGSLITGVFDSIAGLFEGFVDTIAGIGESIRGWFEKDKPVPEQTADEKFAYLKGMLEMGYMTNESFVAEVEKLRREEAQKAEAAQAAAFYSGQTSLTGITAAEKQREAAAAYTQSMYQDETGVVEKRDMYGNIITAAPEYRAEGGMVLPSRGYIVGENGPEYFVPQSVGQIAPNAGSGATVTINMNIQTNNGTDVVNKLKAAFKRAEIVGAIPRGANPFNLNPVTS